MLDCRIPFVISKKRAATSSDSFVVRTRLWEGGKVLIVHSVSVSNADHSNKVAVVGVGPGTTQLWYETLALTTSTYFYHTTEPIVIPSDYHVLVNLISPTSGDVYTINIFGELVESLA